MAGRARRVVLVLGMVLVVTTGSIPAPQVVAKTDVTVDGATVTLTVAVDLIGAIKDDGEQIGLIEDGVRTDVSSYWARASTVWNDAFAKLFYNGCVTFKLDLQFFPKPFATNHTPGHHWVDLDFDPVVRPMVFDPETKDPTKDTSSTFTTDLNGDWGHESVKTISHEVGHLLGLGDDYTDVKDANGNVTGSKPAAGRENTKMAGGDNIDQNIIDRVGKLVENAGRKLPTCWTGTMKSSANETVTADHIGLVCTGTWTTALSLTIATDGTISGTAVAAVDGPPACQGTPYTTQMEVFHAPITGTATDTELHFRLGAPSSYEPAGSADFTALTATIYGADPSGTIFSVPITSPGHAQGAQSLQYGDAAAGTFTSDNDIVLEAMRSR